MEKSLSEKVAELTGLRDSGQLSDSEYEVLLAKAIREMDSSTLRKTPRPTDSSQTSFTPSQTQQRSESTFIKTASSNGVESAVKVVAILVAAVALGFGFLLPFQVDNYRTIEMRCGQPVIAMFQNSRSNPIYMKSYPDSPAYSLSLEERISNKPCQDAAKDRMVVVAVMLVMSTLAVVFSKRVSKF